MTDVAGIAVFPGAEPSPEFDVTAGGGQGRVECPAAWNVPTVGAAWMVTVVIDGPGASGSWTWTTSKSSSRSARTVRSTAAGSGASGATDPLAAVGRLSPSGVTNGSGGGPSHGPSTRTSCPPRRSSRAKPSTCAWTPPGMERLYGQTIPIRKLTRSDRTRPIPARRRRRGDRNAVRSPRPPSVATAGTPARAGNRAVGVRAAGPRSRSLRRR